MKSFRCNAAVVPTSLIVDRLLAAIPSLIKNLESGSPVI
jgi:hypothetical protein